MLPMTAPALALALTGLTGLLAAPKIAPRLPNSDVVPALEKAPDGTPVLVLHTLVCAFQEGEPDALPYTAQSAADCERVTRQSEELRRKSFKRLRVRAGKYVVRAVNVNVPWATAFELRGERDVALPKIEAKEIAQGTGKEMRVQLVAGQYVYLDPVSKTPTYELLVER